MFMLKLNDDKTELVIIAPPYFLHHNKVPLSSVQVGDSGISTSKCARNIGVMFDHHMDMTTQVTKMCQAAWFQLRNIRSVRSSLTKEATLRLVCSLVMPRLDYGNISPYGISEGLLDKLQKAQNAAARLVVKCLRRDHITPHLRDLHWLPVRSRIKYKILVTPYRALHNEAPAYISEMLTPYIPPRTLRSTNTSLLTVPTTHTKHGDRAFSCAAPRLWNELSISIKNCPSTSIFKQSVKTYLFNRAYCRCLIVDCLERLRTAEKADVWRYIKCFILLLLLNMLTVPRFRTKWGSRASAFAAPSTWNSLLVNLKTASTVISLKKMLKTCLFDSAFPPNSSKIRRPVDDLSFASRHWADLDLYSAPLSSYPREFRRYRSYGID